MSNKECKGKKAYPTRHKAERALNILWRATYNQIEIRPCRSYMCRECSKWHLTSKPDWSLTKRQ